MIIFQYYEDNPSKLGSAIPAPRIKYTKEAEPGAVFHFLTYEDDADGEWLSQSIFSLADQVYIPQSKCNTRKVNFS